MQIENWEIDRVIPYEKNPRKSSEAVKYVVNSIREFGFRQPLVVDSDGVLIVGHTRLEAARELGFDRVPVHVAVDMPEDKVKAYRIADNMTGDIAEWDSDLLKVEIGDLPDFDFTDFGFGEKELREVLGNGGGGKMDDDAVPEPPADPVSERGKVYKLGRHRLMCGDSTSEEDFTKLMNGDFADMLLTDPPYGVSCVGKTKEALTIENDDLDEEALTNLIKDAFDNVEKFSRPGAYWFATVPAGPGEVKFLIDWKRRGILRQTMVWVKDSLVFGHSEYHYKHESIMFGWTKGKRHKQKDRTGTSVWEYARPKRSTEHPTMKPVDLWEQMILDRSLKGEIVLDLFLGSGTSVIACHQTERICYGMEFDPHYCDVIRKRWAEFVHGEGCEWQELTPEIPG